MQVRRPRINVVALTGTAAEISALIAGARLGLAVAEADTGAPAETRRFADLLRTTLAAYDLGVSRQVGEVGEVGEPA